MQRILGTHRPALSAGWAVLKVNWLFGPRHTGVVTLCSWLILHFTSLITGVMVRQRRGCAGDGVSPWRAVLIAGLAGTVAYSKWGARSGTGLFGERRHCAYVSIEVALWTKAVEINWQFFTPWQR